MSRRKGQRNRAQVEREYPHAVELEIPVTKGLGHRGSLYQHFCHDLCDQNYTNWPRQDGLRQFTQYRFKTEAHAEAFRAYIAATADMPDDEMIQTVTRKNDAAFQAFPKGFLASRPRTKEIPFNSVGEWTGGSLIARCLRCSREARLAQGLFRRFPPSTPIKSAIDKLKCSSDKCGGRATVEWEP